jgi:hypothetical protein
MAAGDPLSYFSLLDELLRTKVATFYYHSGRMQDELRNYDTSLILMWLCRWHFNKGKRRAARIEIYKDKGDKRTTENIEEFDEANPIEKKVIKIDKEVYDAQDEEDLKRVYDTHWRPSTRRIWTAGAGDDSGEVKWISREL